MARILISAGEASGDIHAAAVTRELKILLLILKFSVWAVIACVKLAAKCYLILKNMG
nr:hypothetical protein [Phascolarctobacterium sp.]